MRVLEIGCGSGELALALAERGYDVVAVDPDAPEGPIFRRLRLEDLDDPGPFDAAFAGRSLHHLHELAGALDHVARLLTAEGILVVDEFAWDRFDERTADWYHGQLRALAAAGGHPAPRSLTDVITGWREEHRDLHTYESMRAALDERFEERAFAWEPYLYRELGTQVAEALERALIDAGAINAVGFRYVGARRPDPL